MSSDVRSIVYKSQDKLIDFHYEEKKLTEVHVKESPQTATYTTVQSSSAANNSSATFPIILPSRESVLDRNILQHIELVFTVTSDFVLLAKDGSGVWSSTLVNPATGGGAAPAELPDFCLRANPITTCLDSYQAQVGSLTLQLPYPRQHSSVLCRFNNTAEQKAGLQSYCSNMYDAFCYPSDYNDVAVDSPFAKITSVGASEAVIMPRTTGIRKIAIADVPGTTSGVIGRTYTITCVVNEAICLPLFECDELERGIYGLNNIIISQTYDLRRMLMAKVAGAVIAGSATDKIVSEYFNPAKITVAVSKNQLLCRQMTAQPDFKLPTTLRLSCPNVLAYSQNLSAGAITPTATSSVTFNSSTVPQVPRFLLFWVTYNQAVQSSTPFMCDRLLPISALNLTIGNKPNVLNGATLEQLYKLSLQSLARCSFAEFIGYQDYVHGAADKMFNAFPLCIDTSLLNLDSGVVAGLRQPVVFSATLTVSDPDARAFAATTGANITQGHALVLDATHISANDYVARDFSAYTAYCSVISEGFVTGVDGVFTQSIGLFSADELKGASSEPHETRVKSGRLTAGNWLDSVKSVVDTAIPIANMVGLGETGGSYQITGRGLDASGRIGGERLMARGLDARGSVGGRKLFQ